MIDISAYRGIGQFGSAYKIVFENDPHAQGSVDWVLQENMIRLCSETVDYLYREYAPTKSLYKKGSRLELEGYVQEAIVGYESHEARIEGIARFTSHLKEKVSEELETMRFGGTEEEIIQKIQDINIIKETEMNLTKEQLAKMLCVEQFPLSSKYDPEWVLENEMGPNALWLTEALCQVMDLKPGMRVLDMGCGRAMSSIFLAKEFGVQVWATDLWVEATDNWERIREAEVEDRVFPIHAEAHALPYAEEFFDAIVSVDSYHYYGTDDLYLKYLIGFLKPGGQIGIVIPGLMRDFEGEVPSYLTKRQPSGDRFWDPAECFSFHTAAWWRRHWEQTQLVDIRHVDCLPEGWRFWLQFEKAKAAAGTSRFDDEIHALSADRGRYLGFVRMVARRKKSRS